MPKHYSPIEKARAYQMVQDGYNYSQVEQKLGINRKTVRLLVRKYNKDKIFTRKKGSGRKKSYTARDSRKLKRMIKSGACETAVDIQRSLDENELKCDSLPTIRRILHSKGLNGRVKVKKPLLNGWNKKRRLVFAKRYKNWTVNDWKKVLFSDETKIRRCGSDGRVYIWREINEKVSERTSKPTVKQMKEDFIIWSCFGYKDVGYAVKLNSTMNAKMYQNVLSMELEENIKWCLEEHDQSSMIFQQDNAPCHKAGDMMNWFEERGITVLDFSAQSPDLNPIENLWSIVKRNLSKNRKIYNKKDLWEAFQEEWNKLGGDLTKKLISSMPKRIQAVIDARGGPTQY